MIFLVVSLLVLSPLPFIWKTPWTRKGSDLMCPMGIFKGWLIAIGVVALVGGCLIPTGIAYVSQLNAKASLTKYDQLQVVYTRRASDLTARFTTILGVQYPKFEKAIFEGIGPNAASPITPATIDAYMVAYPQLKTSETLLELVSQIRSQRDLIYQQQVDRVNTEMEIYVRSRNPWLIGVVLP